MKDIPIFDENAEPVPCHDEEAIDPWTLPFTWEKLGMVIHAICLMTGGVFWLVKITSWF